MFMLTSNFSFLSVPEAAVTLGVTGARVRQLLLSGEMSGRKLGQNWAIPEDEIAKYQKHRRLPGKPRRKS
jgi:excisionase family DNA binding protein